MHDEIKVILNRSRGCAATVTKDSSARLNSLSPVFRGEGRGEGLSLELRLFGARPLTLSLSPDYRGEGTGARAIEITFIRCPTFLVFFMSAGVTLDALVGRDTSLKATNRERRWD
jgi:hypothetical protein